MNQTAHTFQVEAPVPAPGSRTLVGHLQAWWLTRGRIKILLVGGIFYWAASGTHPGLAIVLGALLADYAILARGHWLLRVLIGWLLLNAVYYTLAGGWS